MSEVIGGDEAVTQEVLSFHQPVVEEEKATIARVLHDEVGALMVATSIDVASISRTHCPGSGLRLSRTAIALFPQFSGHDGAQVIIPDEEALVDKTALRSMEHRARPLKGHVLLSHRDGESNLTVKVPLASRLTAPNAH